MGYRIAAGTTFTVLKTHFDEKAEPPTEIPLTIFVYWFDAGINRNRTQKIEVVVGNKTTKGLKLSGKLWPALIEHEVETPGAVDALLAKFHERHSWCLDTEAYLSSIGAFPPVA
jgi:hypothetical protein